MKDDAQTDRRNVGDGVLDVPPRKSPELADIVMSNNGRDAGKKLIVIEVQENYSLLADGKGRRCEKPKLKKNKHMTIIGKAIGIVEGKLTNGDKVTNNEVRRAIREFNEEASSQAWEE
ncbi:MAG: KOW domain-containing RNA-binding protein [Oscillospiraceae bacterium]|nr:KOW domain-containing RNA-binding protein [Oscillospiraceae bacterium]